jgi:hypothetical protein
LPFIEQDELYDRYRQNEPWDSEHNITLLDEMPDFFRHPSSPKDSTTTDYVGFASEATALGLTKGHGLGAIEAGTSNTILFVETASDIPWTKPQDFEFSPNHFDKKFHLNQLRPFVEGKFRASFCDASSHMIDKDSLTEDMLKGLLTREFDLREYDEILIESNPERKAPEASGNSTNPTQLPEIQSWSAVRDPEAAIVKEPESFSGRKPANTAAPKTNKKGNKRSEK